MKDFEEIKAAFKGKLVGTKRMKNYVSQVLSLMPQEIIEHITSNCWFMASMDDAYGFTFTGNDLRDQHLIFLSDDLFEQDDYQIRYTIAHEIGHVVLEHRNSTFDRQSRGEIARQETEADEFASRFV